MEIQVHLDAEKYVLKPTKENTKLINNRIIKSVETTTIQELAEKITSPNGQTWLPAVLEGSRTNDSWKHQQIFALDFDSGITFNEVLNRLKEYGLDCAFAYSTFSNSPEKEKFRVIFQLDHVVTDKKFRYQIQLALIYLFPEADDHCKDASRLFFGGKDLIYENYSYYLDIDLLKTAATSQEVSGASNKNRKIVEIQKKLKSVEKCGMPNNILGTPQKNTFSINTSSGKLEDVNFDQLRQCVKILDDLMKGEWLYYKQLIGLAMNLIHIKGGERLYKKCLKESKHPYEEKHYNLPSILKPYGYLPENLENFSPYEEDWEYTNLLTAARLPRGTVVRINPYQTISLSEAESRLDKALKDALADTGNNIWIIKKATGLGGTEKLLDRLGVTIALPNHALKDEVSKRFRVPHLVTPKLPDCIAPELKEKLEYYYSVGAISQANQLLKDESKHNPVLANYLKKISAAYKFKDTILTTHTKVLYVPFNNDTLIFDEDPLSSILEIGEIMLNDLNRLVQA